MWFEGESTPKKFIKQLADMITSVDNSLPAPAPLWENISSNVGTKFGDDGYVFRSRGSSGKDLILINMKNAWKDNNAGNFNLGPYIGAVESYQPSSVPGQNGSMGQDFLYEYLRLAHANLGIGPGGVDENNCWFKYTVSVTADRVIITTRATRNWGTTGKDQCTFRNVFYVGLIKRVSKEQDSAAVTVATNYGLVHNAVSMRLLKNIHRNASGLYSAKNQELCENNRGYAMIANPIYVWRSGEGVRGEIDGILTTRFSETRGSTFSTPEDAYVLLDGKEYLCLVKPHVLQYDTRCNFSYGGADRQALFIEKK